MTNRDSILPDRNFGGRRPRAVCSVCGQPLARLSAFEWVDRADNKAPERPRWHEHKSAPCPKCHVLLDDRGMCPNPSCPLVQPADATRRTMGEVEVGDCIGHAGDSWWLVP